MERDGFKCRLCGSKKSPVVHHTRSFAAIVKIALEKVASTSEEEVINAIVQEHKLDDGITLCKECHDRHHKEYGK